MKTITMTETHIEIDAAWGKYKIKISDKVGFMKQCLDQLLFYKKNNRIPSIHLLTDIEGYKEILNSEFLKDNCQSFLTAKAEAKHKMKPFKDNRHVIDFLKKTKVWK